METKLVWNVIAYIAGVVLSIVFPYFLAWLETGEPFDWRQNIGRVLVALMGLIPMFAEPEFMERLGAWGIVGALAAGLAFSQAGRIIQKTFDTVRHASYAMRELS